MIKFKLSLLITICSFNSYSQAKSSIGLAGTFNYPAASNYKLGYGQSLTADIKISNKLALSPSIEHEKINATVIGNNAKRTLNLYLFRLTGKYYFTNHLFADAGALLYLGGDQGVIAGGLAATGSAGYQFQLTQLTFIETSLWSHLVSLYENNATPVLGIKVGFKFNLKK